MTRNWAPVVDSFLTLLEKSHIELFAVDDGEGYQVLTGTKEEKHKQALDLATGVDNAWISVNIGSKPANILLIYDEVPADIVADWSIPRSVNDLDLINEVVDKFIDMWDNKPCPTIEDNN